MPPVFVKGKIWIRQIFHDLSKGRLWKGIRIHMAVLVANIITGLDEPEQEVIRKGIKKLGIAKRLIIGADIHKKSLDARNRNRIAFVSSVLFQLDLDERQFCERMGDHDILYREELTPSFPHGNQALNAPIIVVGLGPAGLFCAYTLAKEGYHPIVLERGYDVDRRVEAVERFWKEGILDPECNVQFGEGGAGTFSDGKLTTRISDDRCQYILEQFVNFGAPEEIAVKAKPHIGTDKLRGVIRNMRLEIERLGGEVRFGQKLEKVHRTNGRIAGITVNGQKMAAGALVAALGHSARDTFSMLHDEGVWMEPKGFSVGMRIEHLQSSIDSALYGNLAGHPSLPVGEYQLSYRENGRGVYTFCMCPGGVVVPSSSSEGSVVTNGMSEYSRDGRNANSALVVSVSPEDFGTHPLDGVRFQKSLEEKAFQLGGADYCAIGTTAGDFLKGRNRFRLKRVEPSYALGVAPCRPEELFPAFVTDMMKKGLLRFDRKLRGFAAEDSVLTGVETRTSSPLRIVRDSETLMSRSLDGLYPCGEGAGYAGGIMSAAVDGVRVAQKIISVYRP